MKKLLLLAFLIILYSCNQEERLSQKILSFYDFTFEEKPYGVSKEYVAIIPHDEVNFSAAQRGNISSELYINAEICNKKTEYGPDLVDGTVLSSTTWENDKVLIRRTNGRNYKEIVVRYIITFKR